MLTLQFDPGNRLILETSDEYSMESAVAILHWLTERGECFIPDRGWKSSGFGNLVENGIEVRLENIVFSVMCSYGDIFITRVSGNKGKFDALCAELQALEFEPA